MPSAELHVLTLAEVARLISVHKLSPVEYTESLLTRIEALEQHLDTTTPTGKLLFQVTAMIRQRVRAPLRGARMAPAAQWWPAW